MLAQPLAFALQALVTELEGAPDDTPETTVQARLQAVLDVHAAAVLLVHDLSMAPMPFLPADGFRAGWFVLCQDLSVVLMVLYEDHATIAVLATPETLPQAFLYGCGLTTWSDRLDLFQPLFDRVPPVIVPIEGSRTLN